MLPEFVGMKETYKKILTVNRPALVDEIDSESGLLNQLESKNVLTKRQAVTISVSHLYFCSHVTNSNCVTVCLMNNVYDTCIVLRYHLIKIKQYFTAIVHKK